MGRAHEQMDIHTDKRVWRRDCLWTVLNPPALGCLDSSEKQYCPHKKELWSDPCLGIWHPTCEAALTPHLPDIHHAFIPQESFALLWNVVETSWLDQ